MKKLSLLIISLLMVSIAFSEIGTTTIIQPIKDTIPNLSMPIPVAKAVIKDILSGDSAKLELYYIKLNIDLVKENSGLKDQIITEKDKQIQLLKDQAQNFQLMLQVKDQQIVDYKHLADNINKELRKEKQKSTFFKIGSGIAIGGLIYLLAKK